MALACFFLCPTQALGQRTLRPARPVPKQSWKQILTQPAGPRVSEQEEEAPQVDIEPDKQDCLPELAHALPQVTEVPTEPAPEFKESVQVAQPIRGGGYLPVLGAGEISTFYDDEFDRSRLIGLKDIVLPDPTEPELEEELTENEVASREKKSTADPALASRESGAKPAPAPSTRSQEQQTQEQAGRTLSSNYAIAAPPFSDAGMYMHYFEAPIETNAPIIELPFFLPYQSPPLILEGRARYRIVPESVNAGSAND